MSGPGGVRPGAGRPSKQRKTREAVRKAINRAAKQGVAIDESASIRDLEWAAKRLRRELGRDKLEPRERAHVGSAIAAVHAALNRIRIEARKVKLNEPPPDEANLETRAIAFLEARGWKVIRSS